jgi:D-alanyl-lipoteichoic acid acyltransferase DltB (MBOAT superfamily)
MLFNSLEFLLFFPVVVALYFVLPPRWRWLHLLLASYGFYMAWEPAYALLILASTAVDYTVALRMPTASSGVRRGLLGLSLVMNLGLLFSFKYYNLINGTFVALAASAGIDWPLPESNLLLPVGISFYTFQTLGYTIDVYRGQLAPERHFGHFALYVSYFPQLVAGPIERAGRLLPQLHATHAFDLPRVVSGLRQMLWGMFKKVVVADRLAHLVDVVYAHPEEATGPVVVLSTICFGYQVYCDFSGYSDIAIGAARVMGVDLMRNFDQPHIARSTNEFWTRWHISLITWFRDYVYIPLGGSRGSAFARYRNIAVVFLLSGLWHGAAYTFAIWGLLNAVLITVGDLTKPAREQLAVATGFVAWPRTRRVWQTVSAVALVYSTFIFFRAPDLAVASTMYGAVGSGWELLLDTAWLEGWQARLGWDLGLIVVALAMVPCTELLEHRFRHRDPTTVPRSVQWMEDWLLIVGTLLLGTFTREAFVYFQF